MSVSLEKIDMLMERANISYKEAKEALEAHNGDMVEALIYLEASNKTSGVKRTAPQPRPRAQRPENDFFEDLKKFFAKMHKTSFIIGNSSKRILDIPLTIAALLILFMLPFSLFAMIIPYLFGYKISILDAEGKNVNVEKTFHFGDDANQKSDEDRMTK